jgi:LacI family transcriptional regulator
MAGFSARPVIPTPLRVWPTPKLAGLPRKESRREYLWTEYKTFYILSCMPNRCPKVTMKDVAKEAGVTVGTVSAVLRGSRDRNFYSAVTRERVQAVVNRLGYRVNHAARSLREGKTRTVGVMLDDIALPFLAALIHSTGTALEVHGYSIMLCSVDAARTARESLLQVFARGHVDSFMLAGALTRLSDEDLLHIHNHGHRIVLLERASPDPAIASVGVDNAAGGHLAASHLLQRGCRRLVILGGPSANPMALQRREGALSACRSAGIPSFDAVVLETGGWIAELGYTAMRNHLAAGGHPDSVFACNDLLAWGAIRALREKGIAIPKSVAVIGFDDSPMAAFAEPPLTTIRQPADRMGQAAAELLVSPTLASSPRQHLFTPEIVVRQSA